MDEWVQTGLLTIYRLQHRMVKMDYITKAEMNRFCVENKLNTKKQKIIIMFILTRKCLTVFTSCLAGLLFKQSTISLFGCVGHPVSSATFFAFLAEFSAMTHAFSAVPL